MRTLVDIPEKSIEALEAVTERLGISRAEAVRRAISHYLRYVERPGSAEDFFGLWRKCAKDALAQQRRLRAEW